MQLGLTQPGRGHVGIAGILLPPLAPSLSNNSPGNNSQDSQAFKKINPNLFKICMVSKSELLIPCLLGCAGNHNNNNNNM